MKFNQLKSLAAVAKAGSIQRAASEMHLSQPALSKSIRELERQLGVPLLIRGAGGTSLTPYGAIVAKRFCAIQKEVDKVHEEIDWLRGELGGRLLIGLSPPAADSFVAGSVASFHRLQPSIEVQLLEQRPAHIIEGLRNGLLDFGILHQYGDAKIADFHTLTLRSLNMLIAIGGAYPATPVSMEELRHEGWLTSDLADDPDGYTGLLARHFNVPPPARVVRCTSIALCLELARNLRMISHWAETALPFLAAHFRAGTMTRLELDKPLPKMNIVLAYRDEDLLSPAAALFVRLLRNAADTSAGDNLPL